LVADDNDVMTRHDLKIASLLGRDGCCKQAQIAGNCRKRCSLMCPFLFRDGWAMSKNAEDLVDWFCWFVAGCSSKLGFCSNLSGQPRMSEHQ